MAFLYYAQENILLNDLKSIYFVTPKVACTSIKTILAHHLGISNFDNSDIWKDVHQIVDFPFVQKEEIHLNYSQFFKFGFVRNPWARLVSAYKNKITKDPTKNDLFQKGVGVYSFDDKGINRFTAGMTFDEFLEVIKITPTALYDGHFRRQVDIMNDKNGNLLPDFIGKFENLDEDFAYITKRIGLPTVKLQHFNKSNLQGTSFRDYYSSSGKSLVEQLFAEDIDLFHYKFNEDVSHHTVSVPLAKQIKDAPLVSVIIPTYNDQRHIERSIKSVLTQRDVNVEIIVINDASGDNTSKLLKPYVENNLITVIEHSKRKNLGGSRNAGMHAAKGEYIFFLDSDDWIQEEALSKLFTIAQKLGVDVVAGGSQRILPNYKKEPFFAVEIDTLGGTPALQANSEYKIANVAWGKLFRKKFLTTNKISFTEGIYHEDLPFSLQVLFYCNHYIATKEICYFYYQNEQSITNQAKTELHIYSYLMQFKILGELLNRYLPLKEKSNRALHIALMKLLCFDEILPHLATYKMQFSSIVLMSSMLSEGEKTEMVVEKIVPILIHMVDLYEKVQEQTTLNRVTEIKYAELSNNLAKKIKELHDLRKNPVGVPKAEEDENPRLKRLNEIESSLLWKLATQFYRVRDKYFRWTISFKPLIIRLVKKITKSLK